MITRESFLEAKPSFGLPCPVRSLLDELEGDEALAVVEALLDHSISHSAISKVLAANGRSVRAEGIGKHRRKQCRCFS